MAEKVRLVEENQFLRDRMALRMHEVLQRFSSLEKELKFVEQQVVKEQKLKPQAAAAGS